MFGIHLERCHGNILSFVLMWLKKNYVLLLIVLIIVN